MAKDIVTNRLLLQHIQGMKSDLQTQISNLGKEMRQEFGKVHEELEGARKHREALQEDLYETMRVQGKHSRKIKALARSR